MMPNDRPQMVNAQMEPALRIYKLFMNKTNEKYFNSVPTSAPIHCRTCISVSRLQNDGAVGKQRTDASTNEVNCTGKTNLNNNNNKKSQHET